MRTGMAIVRTWMAFLVMPVELLDLETKVARQTARKGTSESAQPDEAHVPAVAIWSDDAHARQSLAEGPVQLEQDASQDWHEDEVELKDCDCVQTGRQRP